MKVMRMLATAAVATALVASLGGAVATADPIGPAAGDVSPGTPAEPTAKEVQADPGGQGFESPVKPEEVPGQRVNQAPPLPPGMAPFGANTGGCAILWLTTGTIGFHAVGGQNTSCGWGIWGHIQMWGPGFMIDGPTASGPTAIRDGIGHGTVCARLWEDHGGGWYTDRGTACGNV